MSVALLFQYKRKEKKGKDRKRKEIVEKKRKVKKGKKREARKRKKVAYLKVNILCRYWWFSCPWSLLFIQKWFNSGLCRHIILGTYILVFYHMIYDACHEKIDLFAVPKIGNF